MIISAATFSSCNKNNDVIPDVYVDFTINLNDPQFFNLTGPTGTVIVYANMNNWQDAGGFNNNGIIIHAGVDEFYAYDRTCPHDYVVNNQIIKVNLDPDNSLYAICPQCSTIYALSAGGTPASGVSRYPLKNYKTSYYGNYVRVWNH